MNADDLLRRTLRYLQKTDSLNVLAEDIEKYLARKKNEPVAWTNENELGCLKEEIACYMYAEPVFNEGNIPLYLHPPTKTAPMTEEELADLINVDPLWFMDGMNWKAINLLEYARAIERHHGIGGVDND